MDVCGPRRRVACLRRGGRRRRAFREVREERRRRRPERRRQREQRDGGGYFCELHWPLGTRWRPKRAVCCRVDIEGGRVRVELALLGGRRVVVRCPVAAFLHHVRVSLPRPAAARGRRVRCQSGRVAQLATVTSSRAGALRRLSIGLLVSLEVTHRRAVRPLTVRSNSGCRPTSTSSTRHSQHPLAGRTVGQQRRNSLQQRHIQMPTLPRRHGGQTRLPPPLPRRQTPRSRLSSPLCSLPSLQPHG